MSRRRFIATASAVGTASAALGPALVAAQAPKAATKETLRAVVDAADLAITDEQLGSLAGAVAWARGELTKLRDAVPPRTRGAENAVQAARSIL